MLTRSQEGCSGMDAPHFCHYPWLIWGKREPQSCSCPAPSVDCGDEWCPAQQETATALCRFLLPAPAPCPVSPQWSRDWQEERVHGCCCPQANAEAHTAAPQSTQLEHLSGPPSPSPSPSQLETVAAVSVGEGRSSPPSLVIH